MCDIRKLYSTRVCKNAAEDVGIAYKDNIVWICKTCFDKIVKEPWPWDVIEEKV